VLAFIFPGQGSQHVGMGRALFDAFPVARQTFDEADAAFATDEGAPLRPDAEEADLEVRLSNICFNGPEEQLALTETTQPAILTVSVAAWRVLDAHGVRPSFVAGHSLGEYSANVAAGTFAFPDVVAIVRRRGRYMQEAVPVGHGAMAAVLGTDAATVQRACDESAQGEVVGPANINGGGQVVIAGTVAAVRRASKRVKALGAKRVVPLQVSAPFHCALMKPAEERLEPELRALALQAPRVPIVANVDAVPKREAATAVEALVRQVSAPVRWEDVINRLASEGVTTYVEVGPGTVLGGLVRKIHKDARTLHFGSPEELEAVAEAATTAERR
jgi:[acyl-carrier-protein] S-malonyltransferase